MTKHLRWSLDKVFMFSFEEVLTKCLRRSLDKVFTKKSWQSIYEEVITKHLRRSLDKTYTKKSWQSVYEEVITKHLRRSLYKTLMKTLTIKFISAVHPLLHYLINYRHKIYLVHLRWSLDKTYTKKSWQNIYEEVLTKCLRRSLDKVFTFSFDAVWQNIYDEVLTKHLRRSFDKTFTTKSWQSVYV